MVRRISSSQLRSKLSQAQSKLRRAQSKLNSELRRLDRDRRTLLSDLRRLQAQLQRAPQGYRVIKIYTSEWHSLSVTEQHELRTAAEDGHISIEFANEDEDE